MSLTRIDSHYRLTLTSEVRKYVKVRKGQSVYVLPRSNSLIVIPLSIDADSEIDRLIGDVRFTRAARRKAEAHLFRQVKQRPSEARSPASLGR